MHRSLPLSVLLLLVCLPVLTTAAMHQASPPVAGSVSDAAGPVAGARVHLQGQCEFADTDKNGAFRLPASAKPPAHVTAWKKGYAIAATPLKPGPLRLKLVRLPTEDDEDY